MPAQELVMTGLAALWLPILVSSVLVFVVSSAIHMASPWHKSDYPKVPNEDRLRDALRPLAIPPGDYMVPRPSSREEMRSTGGAPCSRSEEHTSELQSQSNLVCRLLLEKKKRAGSRPGGRSRRRSAYGL